jgi:rhodanese-related sulfurtransferase
VTTITPRQRVADLGSGSSTDPAITSRDLHIILICQQGYQSSLAAATLQQLGLTRATDLDGGCTAWATVGLPVIAPPPAGQDPSGNRDPDRSPR